MYFSLKSMKPIEITQEPLELQTTSQTSKRRNGTHKKSWH